MQISTRSLTIAGALLLAAGNFVVPATISFAQSPPPGNAEPSQNISDQKLDQVALALKRVMTLEQDYQQRIATAAPADKQRITDEANGALVKAVTDQGITVPEYNSILQVAENDANLRERILRRVQPPANQ